MGTPEQERVLHEEIEDATIKVTDREGEPEVETDAASLNCLEPALEELDLGSNPNQIDCEDAVGNRTEVEATTVFQLFPEIWDYIFPYLKPTDFQSIINSSPEFRPFFESEMTDRLLPLWLPVFLKNVGIREASALLRWRGVNKTAKSIVDNLLEQPSSPQNYRPNNLTINSPRWTPVVGNGVEALRLVLEKIKTRYNFQTEFQIEWFMEQMSSTPSVDLANPFLTRSLLLEVGGSVVEHPHNLFSNQLILSMVQKYGHRIYSLSFDSNTDPFDVPFLFSILSHLPNLKVLLLCAYVTPSSEEDIARWVPQVQLNQLEVLDVRYVFDVNIGSLLTPLLRCIGPQLRRLICDGTFYDANLEALRHGAFPNLCSLRVESVVWQYLHELSNLGVFLPLQEIELEPENEDFCFADVYQGIRSFAQTLVHLKLCEALGTHENDNNVENLSEFPNLSKFSTDLANIHEGWFRNFIQLQAQRLTELNFRYEGREGPQEPGRQVIAELQQIFDVVPNLKRINIFCNFMHGDYTAEKIVVEIRGIRRIQFERTQRGLRIN